MIKGGGIYFSDKNREKKLQNVIFTRITPCYSFTLSLS